MKDVYIPLISGLVGAIIGALASIITMLIQSRTQDKRERLRMAANLALEDYKLMVEMSKGRRSSILPIAVYLHYHVRFMELLESGACTPESIRALQEENAQITQFYMDLSKDKAPDATASPQT